MLHMISYEKLSYRYCYYMYISKKLLCGLFIYCVINLYIHYIFIYKECMYHLIGNTYGNITLDIQ